ncbi:MAG TPA: hypothetical protein VGL89_02395 [Candidatus Koribacter sp.]|jgi:hypothetical protein
MMENEKVDVVAAEDRISGALDKLEQVMARLEAQYEAMNGKIDRIVAAVEDDSKEDAKEEVKASTGKDPGLENRQPRVTRKTVSPVIANLLAKSGVEMATFEESTVEKALSGLSVEQRIAVKAELARAGVLE